MARFFDPTDNLALKLCVDTCPDVDNCGAVLGLLGAGVKRGLCDDVAVDSRLCLHDNSAGAGR